MAKYTIDLSEDEVNQLLFNASLNPRAINDRHIELAVKTILEVS